MPNAQWPADVPDCILLENFVYEPQPVTIRSPVDSGPAKVRRRYTRPLIGIAGNIVCSRDEWELLEEFHDITLQGGTLIFDFTNPISQQLEPMRFLQPPRLVPIDDQMYTVQLVMERV